MVAYPWWNGRYCEYERKNKHGGFVEYITGGGFESYLTPQYTHIAQLVRAGILYIQGQGFKSLCEYNNLKSMKIDFGNTTI